MSNFDALKAIGAEVKKDKNNRLLVGFYHQNVSNEQLNLLNKVNDDCLLAFYGCDFSECDLKMLKHASFKRIGLIYCKFENNHLHDICEMPSLNWLNLVDTQVTNDAEEKMLLNKPNLVIKLN